MRLPRFSFKTEPVWMLILSLAMGAVGLLIAVLAWIARAS